MNCTICDTETFNKIDINEITLYRCPNCDHCFTDINQLACRESYDESYYDEKHKNWFNNPNTRLFKYILVAINTSAPRNASILDVGCGNGALLKYLMDNKSVYDLNGIDLHVNKVTNGINFIQGDIFEVSLDGKYDVITNLAVIEHVGNVKNFIKRLYELGKENSIFIIMTVNERSIVYMIARLLYRIGYKQPMIRLYDKHHLNHFNTKSLKALVESSNLKVIDRYHHDMPIAAVDIPQNGIIIGTILKTFVWIMFIFGKLTRRTILQTIVCKKY